MELAERETGKNLVKCGFGKIKRNGGKRFKATSQSSVVLFVCPSKILHKHCFHFLLGRTMVPGENKNLLMQNFAGQTKNIMVFLKVVYAFSYLTRSSHHHQIICYCINFDIH